MTSSLAMGYIYFHDKQFLPNRRTKAAGPRSPLLFFFLPHPNSGLLTAQHGAGFTSGHYVILELITITSIQLPDASKSNVI